MRAVIQTAYGAPDVLEIREIEKPVPRDKEVLLKLKATSVTSGDARLREFNIPAMFWLPARLIMGITRPRKAILGAEFAGIVEAVGKDVSRFKVGDAVFGQHVYGCHAQYKCLPETAAMALKPTGMSFDEAAGVAFGGLTALYFLRQGQIAPGQNVLINGASGAVGIAAVQLAKHFGADVAAVTSGGNAELVRSLGADVVIDYTTSDCTEGSARYDIVMDTVGTLNFARARTVMQPKSYYLSMVMSLADIGQSIRSRTIGDQKVIGGVSSEKREDVEFLAELIQAGRYHPVIDRIYDFDEIRDAHAYVDTGRKRGAVVVHVA